MFKLSEIKMELMSEATCRLCLTDSDNSQSIFDSDSLAQVTIWIEDLTSLKITNVPSAPASLCLNCKTTLKNFEEFRNMCFSNNSIFNKLFVENDKHTRMLHSKINTKDVLECVNNSNSLGMVEFVRPDPLETLKIDIEEPSLSITDQIEDHKAEPTAQTKIKDKPAIRGQKLCPVCNEYVSGLGKHVTTNHKSYQPFQCEYCSRRFNVHGNLVKHIRRHLQVKTHICPHCGKGFTNTGELKVHVRVHTNEKPYPCTECGKSFKTSGMLCRHRQSHEGRRPHTCDVCQAKFYTAEHLRRHMTLHTGERAYSCNVCNKKFTRPSAARVKAHKCIGKSEQDMD